MSDNTLPERLFSKIESGTHPQLVIQVRLRTYAKDLEPGQAAKTIQTHALVDTGAVRCYMPIHVMECLGLQAERHTTARYADGRLDEVELTEPVLLEIMDRATFEGFLVLGDEVLVGQTALETTDLLVDCTNRRVIPNPAHPNTPITNVR